MAVDKLGNSVAIRTHFNFIPKGVKDGKAFMLAYNWKKARRNGQYQQTNSSKILSHLCIPSVPPKTVELQDIKSIR